MCAIPKISELLQTAESLNYAVIMSDKGDSFTFENPIGSFTLTMLNSTAHIAESHDVYIQYGHRGHGLGKQQHEDRLKIAKAGGLTHLIAVVNVDSKPQIKNLTNFKWTKLMSLDEHHNLWIKEL